MYQDHRKPAERAPGRQSGLTLIELLVTIAIVGILAAIAQPSYTDYLRRARLVEGTEALLAYRTQMEHRYQDVASYADADGECAITLPGDTENFAFACAVDADGQTYTATATGADFLNGYAYSIDDAGNRVTTAFPGHADPVACWLTKRSAC